MSLMKFARMCESLEELVPTAKQLNINRSLSSFKNKSDVIKIPFFVKINSLFKNISNKPLE